MVRIGLVVVFLCWFVVAPLSAQTTLLSPDGWFDSRWSEQTDNVGVEAAHRCTLVHKADGSVQVWGRTTFPLNVPSLPTGVVWSSASVSGGLLALLRSDGLIAFGCSNPPAAVPALPAGVVFTKVAAGYSFVAALRSDGQIVAFGNGQLGQLNVPPLPAGLVYTDVAVGAHFQLGHGLGLRSDGTIATWGTTLAALVPALPGSTTYTAISAGTRHSAAVRSDGAVVAWGDNSWGQCSVPPLPLGVRYVQVAAAARHTLARRDDGVVVAFGDNTYGQCNVPPLPAGASYVDVAVGGLPVVGWLDGQHSVALRSDGRVIAWGDNGGFQCGAPVPPTGVDYVAVAGSEVHQVALRSDGNVVAFGLAAFGLCDVPPLPPGVVYVEVEPLLARRSDGQVVAWGDDPQLLAVPQLPSGVTYTGIALGAVHALARRSDGQVVAWGDNGQGQCVVPPLPPNTSYVAIAAGGDNSMALRSDGELLVWGQNQYGQCQVPSQVAASGCVEFAAAGLVCFARCRDGQLWMWGSATAGYGVPGLPFGVTYVGLCGTLARRSDGTMVRLDGFGTLVQAGPGSSVQQMNDHGARVGPTSTYISFAPGCGGSLPATRLVPLDTPRIGDELLVTLFDLPANLAVVCTGLSTQTSGGLPLPAPLAAFGMPGCTAFVSADHLLLLAGANQQATLHFAIPNQPALVGARFHQQAFVPDAGAGNPLLGVVSNAATAIVGH